MARKTFYLCLPLLSGTTRFTAAQAPAQTSAQAPAQDAAFQLQTTVRRTVIDVVVTDSHGKPVRNLKAEDFGVFENGVPQPLRHFDAHAFAINPATPMATLPKLPQNTFANIVSAQPDAPVTVVLYDVLNTPLNALPYAHEALTHFIKQEKGQSTIAIFVLGEKLQMLQGFTDDQTRLLAAANSRSAGSRPSRLLGTNTDASEAAAALDADLPTGAVNVLDNLKSLESTETTFFQQQRLDITVDAFTEIARFLAALPGRKSLIWLSGSFPGAVLPSSDPAVSGTANEFGDAYSYDDRMRTAEDLLSEAHVAVYPVDVRGLQVNPAFTATTRSGIGPGANAAISRFDDQQSAEHQTMDSVADSTGGRAFYNTNGLGEAMHSAMTDGSTYYTLVYAPTNTKFDGRWRTVKVVLREPGYHLSYREGYFAGTEAPPPGSVAPTVAEKSAQDIFLDASMEHGAPASTQLFFSTGVYPVGGIVAATPAEMEALKNFEKIKLRKIKHKLEPEALRVQHYRVSFAVLGRSLELPAQAEGKYESNMTFALAAYTADGTVTNGMQVDVRNLVPLLQYAKIRTEGYRAELNFVSPVDADWMRIAVRDNVSGHLGTVEIPLPQPAPLLSTTASAPPASPGTSTTEGKKPQ
jgi:VWFA-related protein